MKLADPQYRIRPANKEDIPGLTEVFFRSFNAPFWQYLFPDTALMRQWWHQAWQISLDNPTDRTFVVEDTSSNDQIVAFSRWMVPQPDGNLERKWPVVDETYFPDMELVGAFFGGMEESRHSLMGKEPHWMLELLGVHEKHQRRGIGASLIKRGTDHADREGLSTYLDASEIGQPYYLKTHGFKFGSNIEVPDRPEYGSFMYKGLVRPPQTTQ
ncbi:uncharacterized protein LTR77_006282 [Saxophila tyrrhenica]|uniref:N-acetyltransferase domain-containing protein n=1 Tax=Saxophila tyrrhenica TaxID=1690608 RepID=A0AAV9P7X6_9PEZI|nr:hypothetical protein LTR77_006282 [Saxophila tyrrhenica]